jgi:hypothetical protein
VARVVCVHGIRQQYKGEETALAEWAPGLRDGMRLAGPAGREIAASLGDGDIRFAFYGDLFRPPGQTLAIGDPRLGAEDLTEFEQELLYAWWREAAEVDPAVIQPDERTLARTPRGVQAALRALSGAAFFAGLTERLMLGSLVQVRRYFTEPAIRAAIQHRVAAAVDERTRVVIGHSLGSVVAYEALCAHPEWPAKALVTLGSPLGIRNLIFDRLRPSPVLAAEGGRDPRGHWPGSVTVWSNVADRGDVTALVKDLRPLFGDRVVSYVVHNGAKAHDVRPYLTAPETGKGILAGLTDADIRT